MNRRQFIQTASTATVIGFAGCSGSGSSANPKIEDVTTEGNLLGETEFQVLVKNKGSSGEVLVTVEIYNGDNEKIDTSSKKVSIPEGEINQISISMEVPDEAEYYEATAEPV